MPSEANQSKAITSVTVVAAYDNNANTAYFDNISLRLEPSQTYRYDANGNPVAATQPGTGSESATYASNGIDLTSYTAANGTKYTYTYNSAHDVTTAKVGGLTATTIYNAAGNVTGSKLTATGTSLYMETSATTTTDKNHTASVTDASGYTTRYAYNSDGQLTSVTNAKGQLTTYTYDPATLRTNSTFRSGIANIDYGYTDGRLTTLDRKTFRDGAEQHQYYYFAYNAWGQPTTTKVGSRTLSTNTYYNYKGDNTGTGGNLKTTTYGNNDSVSYFYDELDRLIRKKYNDSNEYTEYFYNAEGMIGELRHCSIQNNQSTLTTYRFEYDSLGRLVRSSESVGDTVKLRTEHIYDGYNRLSKQKWSANGSVYTEYYTYDDGASGDGSLKQFRTTSGQKINLTYDKLKRLQKSSITSNGGVEYYTVGQSYYTSGNKTTQRVEYYNYRMTGGALVAGDRYVYDALGNITEIQESEPASGSSVRRTKVRYTYDDQNQLKTETRYTYSSNTDTTGTAVTSTYTYDTAGNIRSASDGTSTLSYTYGDSNWHDLLTKVGTTTISYDGSGNPSNWYNGTKSYSGLTWQNGRQLAQITVGGKTSKYTYDADGIRSTKDVNGTKHEYRTLNGKVVWEKIGEGTSAKIMVFSYDAQGRPFAFKFSKNNGASYTNYFYALNQQGDVVKIFRPVAVKDADGNVTGYTEKTYATYTYDAWGKLIGITNSAGTSIINKQTTSTSLANLNPLRYRGYYYDNETGFYYLQSRYYDPAVRRFINADSATATNVFDVIAYNMFAYCGNNPVVRTDASGHSWFSSLITAVAVVVVATVVAATVIASAGLVACAAVGVATSVGLSAGATAAVSTAATVGCYVVGGGIAACGLNDGMEIATGENYIRDKLLGGSQEAYDRVRTALSIATLAIGSLAEQAQAAGISCFIAGTSVVTADGQKPIEDIQVGDYVWAWDEETDDVALRQVVETYINETTELTHVFVNGEEIVATPTHPFYCPVKGWTDAAHLRAGDILVLVNGEYVVVEKVQHELLENPVKVYNFQVEDYHTYYVASGVLVHNSCNHGSEWNSERNRYWKNTSKVVEEDKNYGAYIATQDNINRMSRGAAPIGWDGWSVQLHHWDGITVDFYNYSPLSRTLHQLVHKLIK